MIITKKQLFRWIMFHWESETESGIFRPGKRNILNNYTHSQVINLLPLFCEV